MELNWTVVISTFVMGVVTAFMAAYAWFTKRKGETIKKAQEIEEKSAQIEEKINGKSLTELVDATNERIKSSRSR